MGVAERVEALSRSKACSMYGLALEREKANGAEACPLSQKPTVMTMVSHSWSNSGFGFSLVVSEVVVQMTASSFRTRSVSLAAR
eukprot:4494615-Pyramimonas_sp.AAC.1